MALLSGTTFFNFFIFFGFLTFFSNRKSELFIIMEYVDYGSIDNFPAIPENALSQITLQLLFLFTYLKKMRIMHRDIKPQNIFMSSNAVIKVGDFGVSKQQSSSEFLTAKVCNC